MVSEKHLSRTIQEGRHLMMSFETIQGDQEELQKKSLKEGVFELLHQRIVAGRYSPGEWLRQEEISTQLGVSQTPVREALDLLVSVGLAERVPYRGVRVPKWSAEEIVDAYVLRLILESAAARMAALNIKSEALKELRATIEQTRELVKLEDMSTHRQLNKRFHLMIAEASENFLMSKLYEMASNLFPDWRLYEYMFRHPELLELSLKREYKEHQAIVEAIAQGDPDEAAARTIQHIRNLRGELIGYLGVPETLLDEKELQIITLLPVNSLAKYP
jgi:DNA-binding GntR family transcriptional regulator